MVRRWVNATAWIAGDAVVIQDALAGDPSAWLPASAHASGGPAAETGPDGGWDVLLRVGTSSQPLHVVVGPARSAGPSHWRTLSWSPALHADVRSASPGHAGSPAATLRPPRVEAQVGTVPVAAAPCPGGWTAGDAGLWLLLTGSYVPPLGVLGIADDQVAVERLAESCATALVAQIADRLRGLARPTAATTGSSRPPPAAAARCSEGR